MPLSLNDQYFLHHIKHAINEVKACLHEGGAYTYAPDLIQAGPKLRQKVTQMRNDTLDKELAQKLLEDESLSVSQQHTLRDATLAKKHKVANCGEQADLLACYLWRSPKGVKRIEIVGGQHFDHVFILLNRPWCSDLNTPTSWGTNTWLADPWSEYVSKLEDPSKNFQELFHTGFKQALLLAAAGVTDLWRFSRHSQESLSTGLNLLASISPQDCRFPSYIALFSHPLPSAMPEGFFKALNQNTSQGLKKTNLVTSTVIESSFIQTCCDIAAKTFGIKQSLTALKEKIDRLSIDEICPDTQLTALSVAVMYDNVILADFILKHGANPIEKNISSYLTITAKASTKTRNISSIYLAAYLGHSEVFKLLWNKLTQTQQSAQLQAHEDIAAHLMAAAIFGKNANIVKSLVDFIRKDPNAWTNLAINESQRGHYILLAATFGHSEILQSLLSCPDMPLSFEDDLSTALLLCCYYGHEACVELLLQRQRESEEDMLNINQEGLVGDMTQGATACHIALSRGLPKIAINIIQSCAEFMNEATLAKLWNHASLQGSLAVIQAMCESKSIPTDSYIAHPGYLAHAINSGHADVVDHLLEQGANIESKYEDLTPVMRAICYCKEDIYFILARRGAILNRTYPAQYRSLESTIHTGRDGLLAQAIEKKCSLETILHLSQYLPSEYPHIDNAVKLQIACFNNNFDSLNDVLSTGINVNSHWNGFNPLMIAIINNKGPIAQFLLQRGANPNYTLPNGQSLLRIVIENNSTPINDLIEAGANPFAKDNFDKLSPIELAYKREDMHAFRQILYCDKSFSPKRNWKSFLAPDDKAKAMEQIRAQTRQQMYLQLFNRAYLDNKKPYLKLLIKYADDDIRTQMDDILLQGDNTALNQELLPLLAPADSAACTLQ